MGPRIAPEAPSKPLERKLGAFVVYPSRPPRNGPKQARNGLDVVSTGRVA